jgi:general secretion pathway protein N
MLRAVWSAKWYILLGLLAFILIVVATTPIHFLWKYAEPPARSLPVRIENPAGTVWQGRVNLGIPQAGIVATEWQLSPWSLMTGAADLELKASGDNVRFEGQAHASGLFSGLPDQLQLTDVSGYVDSAALMPLLMQARATLEGDFELSRLNANIDIANRKVSDATGQLVYSGGQLRARVERQSVDTELPMLVANLMMEGDKLVVPVATAEGDPLGQLFMQPDGWGGMTVLRRAVDIAGQSWPDKQAEPDTVIFEVSQKFL